MDNFNFTAKYLGVLNNRILDENGLAIPSLNGEQGTFFFEYNKPVLIVDSFQVEKKQNEPYVVEIKTRELYSLGFVITSKKESGHRVQYNVCKKERVPMGVKIHDGGIPRWHKLEMDMANHIVRIVGRASNGEWQDC